MANRLAAETSPYLLQHAENPVDWYPWGEEALRRAREEQRPLLVSIGYSACHWCHVMAHESFEDPEVAALGLGQCLLAPGVPVDRVLGVLSQIGGRGRGEPIHSSHPATRPSDTGSAVQRVR